MENFIDNNSDQFIPYGKHHIAKEDISAVTNVLRSSYLTQGKTVPKFEEEICHKVNSKFSVAVNSATSALHIACLALKLSKGDYLWTSPTTFVASANCGIYCGAKVDFVDIDPKTGLLSVKELEKKLENAKKNGKLPKILIPVHLAGNPCEMEEISKLSNKFGFKIIEDASHAIGSNYRGESIGNCKYSDITIFSFHPVKIITTAEGGIATTNDPLLAKRMKLFRSHGITKEDSDFINHSPGPWFYEQQNIGFNYRMSDIHAALGLSQLKRLDEITFYRNIISKKYMELLYDLPLSFLEITKDSYSSFHLVVIRLNSTNRDLHREVFIRLREENIGVQLHYMPVHLQPYYQKIGFKKGDFPESEFYANNAMSLPVYYGLKEEEQLKVIKSLKKIILN